MKFHFCLLSCFLLTLCPSSFGAAIGSADKLFPLSIIHINDFHARYEWTDVNGDPCDGGKQCIGGYARTVYTVKRLLQEQAHQNPIYINAGDSFQGTLWYNVGRWNVTAQFLNMLPADAMTLGNHEFDHGVEGVVPFLERVKTNMLVANMDSSLEPTMMGKYNKSTIIERSNRKIGIIGVILETTNKIANTGHLIFRNESDTIREEAIKLKAEGANIIIVISHCGYDVDLIIAKNAGADIDVIIGGHTHTFLYTGDHYPGPHKPNCHEVVKDIDCNYPTEVIHESGNRVLIVQAFAFARYVGNLTVFFDDAGHLIDYSGEPLYMGADVPEDEEVKAAMMPWKELVDAQGKIIIGHTKVDMPKVPCIRGECNLGNFYSDAMVHSFVGMTPYNQNAWTNAAIGLVTYGTMRQPLHKGNITFSQMVTMSPFENVLTTFNLSGKYLLEALEYSVAQIDLNKNITDSWIFLQVSGLKITYDLRQPIGKRVMDLKVRCADCDIPTYEDFDVQKIYRIVAPYFIVVGGDGFNMFRDHAKDLQGGSIDIDALINYTKSIDPIITGLEKRITIV